MTLTPKATFVAAAGTIVLLMACRPAVPPDATTAPGSPPATSSNAGDPPAAADSYTASIQQFQRDRESALRSDTGWLTIAGLYFLSRPSTTFGSDPLNDIVLPAGAPTHAGAFEMRNGRVRVQAAPGVAFQLADKTVTAADLKSDAEGTPDRIGLADLQLWVHMSGGRMSIRLRDKNSSLLKDFTGTQWFPIDEGYRVEAEYVPYDKPRIIQVPNILGDIDEMPVPGAVTFTLNGQSLKMEPFAEPGDTVFWFIFRDLTSGRETYPAARFLYVDVPVNGRMVLDFNKAQNPPCAYNPYTTCPLPHEQNRLRLRVEAGEKAYGGHP
jgi:uncharacterized protein (DUF1684 family)